MNILIPHTWLLEYLDTKATPLEIQMHVSLSGPSIERIYEIEGESVYDIEVTTNRVDSMSVRGIAREAAVILTQSGIPAKFKPTQRLGVPKATALLPLPTVINDLTLCKRVMGVVLQDVKRVESPEWMQQRLRQVSIQTHDIVIDTTNYITHELGHPCHAFDYDRLIKLGGTIIVRRAEKGKSFTTLDGVSYTTVGGEIVFENKEGIIIDLPGIKGTANTAITDSTANVFLWMESIDPKSVRFASMEHAIRTVAAQLNEKNVDAALMDEVMEKGIALLCEFAGAQIASEVFDETSVQPKIVTIKVPLERIETYLGISVPSKRIVAVLEMLGCSVEYKNETVYVTPPSFRPDLTIPEDIIEEVARIYGYHNLNNILMPGSIPTNRPQGDNFSLEYEAKQFFATLGAQEVYTYSLISEEQAKQESSFVLGLTQQHSLQLDKTHLRLKNPLTDDLVYLRRTLWVSHLAVLQANPDRKNLCLFEFANVYTPRDPSEYPTTTLPSEEFHVTLTQKGDQRAVKGIVESLLRTFHMDSIEYIATQNAQETMILSGDVKIGTLVLHSLDEGEIVTIVDLDWKAILPLIRKYPTVKPISKYSPIIEDLTFTIPIGTHIAAVLKTIQSVNTLITTVRLKGLYKQNATFTLTYHDPKKNLASEDIAVIRKTIVTTLATTHLATLVGSLA